MKLGYICTNFNNSNFTVQAIRSLLASAAAEHELSVIVVDNLSKPDDRAMLKQLAIDLPCVDLILNDENVGYFPGLNFGIKQARAKYPDVEYWVIGNNDLEFGPEFCNQLERQRMLLQTHAVVCPDIVTLDGEHQNPQVIDSIGKFRELIYDLYYSSYVLARVILWLARVTKKVTDRKDELMHRKAQHIYQGHGSCYLIGPKFFATFTELWAPTFLMGEEFFLSKQLSEKGMRFFYNPSIQVTHCCHGSLRAIPSEKIWQYGRIAHKLYRKHIKIIG